MKYWELLNLSVDGPFQYVNKKTDAEWGGESLDDDTLLLSFQGSLSVIDWIYNFMTKKVPYKGANKSFKVHRGFLKKYKSIRDDVLDYVKNANPKKIIVSGHSQGGAMASLALEDLEFHGYQAVRGIVFGCPRVFSKTTEEYRFYNLLRVENGNDIVTKFPMKWQGYRHFGKGLLIGSKKENFKISIKDHNPMSYAISLKTEELLKYEV